MKKLLINTIAGNEKYGYGGDDGPPLLAEFHGTTSVVVDDSGDVYISDNGNNLILLITKHPLSVSNLVQNKESINIYHKPCYDHCTIQISSASDEKVQVSITDIMGGEASKYKMLTNQPFTFQTDLPPGVYCIKAITTQEQLKSHTMKKIFRSR